MTVPMSLTYTIAALLCSATAAHAECKEFSEQGPPNRLCKVEVHPSAPAEGRTWRLMTKSFDDRTVSVFEWFTHEECMKVGYEKASEELAVAECFQ